MNKVISGLAKVLSKLDNIAGKLPFPVVIKTGNPMVIIAWVALMVLGAIGDILVASQATANVVRKVDIQTLQKDTTAKDLRDKRRKEFKARVKRETAEIVLREMRKNGFSQTAIDNYLKELRN
jgi:hypothetical protein